MYSSSDRLLNKFTYVAPSVIIPRPKWTFNFWGRPISYEFKQRQLGLFAKTDISEGTYIGEYEGLEVVFREYYKSLTYVAWQRGYEGDPLDRPGILGDNWLRFANHQPEETANLKVGVDYSFHTKRDVSKGEELTWFYGPGVEF